MFKKSLLALALGGFGIGMTEFVMMGILPDIATSLKISIPEAGHLISIYALGVVVGAPIIVGMSGKIPPRKILTVLMAVFGVVHAICALAPSYPMLMIGRFVSGLPHGAFFGVGAVVASRLAEKGKAAQAVSVMFAGLTVANLIGVPLGTYLGHIFSWRLVMVLIAIIGFVAAFSLHKWLPVLPANPAASFRQDLKIFAKADTWFVIFITSIGTGGFFAWISYIAPLAIKVTGMSETAMTSVLVLAGFGMTVGNTLGGRLADKYSPIKATISLLIAMATCLLVMVPASQNVSTMLLMTFVTGMIAFALVAPIQMLIIRATEGSEMLGSALGQASFNIGNAIGAYLGGLPLVFGFGFNSPQLVGAGLAIMGCLISTAMFIKNKGKPETPISAEAAALMH